MQLDGRTNMVNDNLDSLNDSGGSVMKKIRGKEPAQLQTGRLGPPPAKGALLRSRG
jgi:hypothetical protein